MRARDSDPRWENRDAFRNSA